ncbi:SUKH-4 family immunity protein [Streptomyces uncialis]|uniref:SUKH-4 family immunity protein n=1 Tax=Streptomyces uncialis TaxID=1048205 RepID=UPI0037F4874B
MIFDITRDGLARVFGTDGVRPLPRAAVDAAGITGGTARFLTGTGLPHNDFVSFPDLTAPGASFQSLSAPGLADTWNLPDTADRWVFLGNFEISALVLDPATGVIHQLAEGIMQAVPLHRDVSSLTATIVRLTELIRTLPEDIEDDDEALEHLEHTLDTFKQAITQRDPLPFASENSEWREIITAIGAGMWRH